MLAHNIDRFLNAAATSDDVFSDDETFVGGNREAATEDEAAGLFLDKNVAFAQRATYFLSDNDPAEGRGDDSVALQAT